MKKIVLVTGAAGFIGFHLAQHLHERGDTVIGFDNFNDYYTPQLKRDRAALLKKKGIVVHEGDLCDAALLNQLITNQSVTHIAHLAAQAGVRYSLTNPQAYIKSNIEGFTTILEACKINPKIKLTYASSSSVYGLNATVPFSVENRTDHQASFYGVTKKTNELMAQTYHHLYGIAVTGLRFFTVYGPWGRPDMAYFSFTRAILEDKPIDVYNHGKLQRDFTYIDDIIQGTVAAIDLGAPCEIFNLGNHRSVALGDFIAVIENALGKKAKKNLVEMQAGDVLATYADIQHSQKMLGFHPTTPIEKGIPLFVEWYKNYYLHK
jgi:UDP-glucuronate 4-epimerase